MHFCGLFVLLLAVFLLVAGPVFAAAPDVGVSFGDRIGLGSGDPRVMAGRIIQVLLGFIAIIMVSLFIYAGFLWMTAAGNEAQIETAKDTLKRAVIGLLIILMAFSITQFVISKFLEATGGSGGPGGGGPGGGGGGLAALGSGIIESHYPGRQQRDVPRNTFIAITFREPMDVSTIMSGANINAANISIAHSAEIGSGPYVTNVAAATNDNRTFLFDPADLLGSPSEATWYTILLGTGIRKADGSAAFPGTAGGYEWSFEVGTLIDNRPPRVTDVIPAPGATEPRNVVIAIYFDEAMNPLTASGQTADGYDNIAVSQGAGTVAGNFYSANQYRVTEFLTEDACGVNSCGETVYCLPGGASLSVLGRAATLATVGQSAATMPFNGLVDMAGNSLDGNSDSAAQGPTAQSGRPAYNWNAPDAAAQGDDFTWNFQTNNLIDITPPVMTAIGPAIGSTGIDLNAAPYAIFNKLLMSASLRTGNIDLSGPAAINFWISADHNVILSQSRVNIDHDAFAENSTYTPRYKATIKDIYQNCYRPSSGPGCTGTPSCCNGGASGFPSCP